MAKENESNENSTYKRLNGSILRVYQEIFGDHGGKRYHDELNDRALETFEDIKKNRKDYYDNIKEYENDDE